ncbi:MAG: proteasome assembly chaperone family protein [Aquiluna sp.]
MSSVYREYGFETKGLPMLALLTGFSDSGATVQQLSEHLFANLENEVAIKFDNDELLDYRSRRPILYFEKDHIDSYEPANLAIYLMKDEADQPFLLLEGYEPDMKWESFANAIVEIAEAHEISSFTWVHAIPFPIPHTRATGVTVSGNRKEMIDRFSEWKPQTQVPGNIVHLLEYRLIEAGFSVAGFVLLVPHYLADNEVPKSALSGLELITAATGLVFPSDDLRDRANAFDSKVNTQVQDNPELSKLIQTLEQGYANGETAPARAPLGRPAGQPPSADQIADELEKYLANLRRNTEGEKE